MLSRQFNPVTAREEWFEMEEDYDTRRDIARSTYGDMLHDKERNKQYYKAIKKEIKAFASQGKVPYCLDIGTGSGLLSMMAASAGVHKITACEAFHPVAKVAVEIIEANGLDDNIEVLAKSSMETSIPKDMPEKADLVVMELFDTELIGEGLLPSMRHAHQHLVKENATVIPAAAVVYVQILQSQALWERHQLSPNISDVDGTFLNVPAAVINCKGAPCIFDVQADEISSDSITELTEPIPVLRLLFCVPKQEIANKNREINTESVMDDYKADQISTYFNDVTVTNSGEAHVILMWWVLEMDKEGEILLSMAPKWVDRIKAERNEWRDHWMQGIYFVQKSLEVKKGDSLSIQTSHDDFMFWFEVNPSDKSVSRYIESRIPSCTCGFHDVWSRPRFAMVNDFWRRETFYNLSKELVKNGSRVGLVISDSSILCIFMAMAGFEKVYVLEPEAASRRITEQIVKANHLTDKVIIHPKKVEELTKEDIQAPIDVILGEPFFLPSLVPWHDLYFWYASRSVVHVFDHLDIKIFPKTACLKAVGVQLKELWKIKSSLGTVEGFNIQAFDELIQSCSVNDEELEPEPHSMWEYPCRALTDVFNLIHFDFQLDVPERKQEETGMVDFVREGHCNAVVLWIDYSLKENIAISTGLEETTLRLTNDGYVKNWVKSHKQGVYFLHESCDVGLKSRNPKLRYNLEFRPGNGSFAMKFEVTSSDT